MATNNSVNLQTANFTPTGNWNFTGTINANTPNQIMVFKTLLVDPLPPPVAGEARLLAESNLVLGASSGDVTLTSQSGDVTIDVSTGNLDLTSPATVSVDSTAGNLGLQGFASASLTSGGGNVAVTANTDILIQSNTGTVTMATSSGNMSLTTATGNLTLEAGNSLTSGHVSIISETEGISFNAATTFQSTFDSMTFTGVSASSLTLSNGTFQLGTNNGSVIMTAHIGGISLLAGTGATAGDINLESFIGDITLTAGNEVLIQSTPTFDVQTSVSIVMSSVSVVIGTNVANTNVGIGNSSSDVTINGLIYSPDLPGGAPGGSVAVLWDPAGKRFYHA